ncbi:hypothetical protein SPFL3102_02261 [Sporomusaceae bacterium FL31]|nr:hypothetical protein SPFL3101_02323 [Sporomusaceae bacterium FL31]GCE34450.1 hypothetical protein SPFL3102_02261 [Sporomusaceae bacterium]
MANFAYWVITTAIGVGIGWYLGKIEGVIFMGVVSALVGFFLLFEEKTHIEN